MAGPANFLLQQIAAGAQPRMADAMAKGYQQGNALLQMRQAQEDRNALAQIAQAFGQHGPDAAYRKAGELGQLEAATGLYTGIQDRAYKASQQDLARQRLDQPMSAVGKLRSDLTSGRITSDEYKAGMQALQSRVGGFMTVSPGSAVIDRTTGQQVYQAPTKAKSMTPSERKAYREDQETAINLDATIGRLDEAIALVPNAFEGAGAGARGYVGTNLPDWIVHDSIANPQQAKATSELQKILNLEAVQAMAQNLKGATTNFELQEFQRILADPTAPNDVKLRTIQRMKQLAENQLALSRQRIDEFEGGQEQQQAIPQQSGVGTGNTADEQQAINGAIDAINRGADPALVRQRLEQFGIDPAVLD